MSSTDSAYTTDMVHQMLADLMSTPDSQHSHHSDLLPPFQPWATSPLPRDEDWDRRLDANHFSPLWSLNGVRETRSLEQRITAVSQKLDTFQLTTTRRFDHLEAKMGTQGPQGAQTSPELLRAQDEIARLNSIIKELQDQDTRKEAEVDRLAMTLEFEMEGKRDLEAKVKGLEKHRLSLEDEVKALKESETKAKQDLQESVESNFELQKAAICKIQSLQKSLDSMTTAKKSLEDGKSKIQNSLRQEIQNLKTSLLSEIRAKSSLHFKVRHLQETLDGVTEIQKSFESEIDSLKKTLVTEQKEHNKVMEEKEKLANQKIIGLENRLKEASSSTAPWDSQIVLKLQKTVENQSKQYKELQKKSKQDTLTIWKMQKKLDEKDEEIEKLQFDVETYLKKLIETRDNALEAMNEHESSLQENLKMGSQLKQLEDMIEQIKN